MLKKVELFEVETLIISAVPFANVPDTVTDSDWVILSVIDVKVKVPVGTGTTVIVTLESTENPRLLTTLNVYGVVTVGLTI